MRGTTIAERRVERAELDALRRAADSVSDSPALVTLSRSSLRRLLAAFDRAERDRERFRAVLRAVASGSLDGDSAQRCAGEVLAAIPAEAAP